MTFIKHMLIREKLVAITMISTVFSLVVVGSVITLYSWKSNKDSSINRLHVLSNVVGDRSKAALLFDDKSLIEKNLKSLAFEPSITLSCIYNTEGVLVGEYSKAQQQYYCGDPPDNAPANPELFFYDNNGNIFVHHIISIDDDKLGEIIIYSDHEILNKAIMRDVAIIVAMILIGILISYTLIKQLHGYISGPIRRLSLIAKNISDKQDFSIRAGKENNDETGLLVDAFNNMLDTITHQNLDLIDAKNSYLALYDKNPMMLFTLSQEGIIKSVNEFGAAHLGINEIDLVDHSINNIILENDLSSIQEFILKCSTHVGQVHRRELRLAHHSDIIWVRVTARSIVETGGEQNILFVCEDITEARRLSEQLSYQASHDALTGLVNRREFEHRVNNALQKSRTDEQEHALFFLDLDQFKVINDTCGHIAGDQLLRELVSVVNTVIRQGDTLARVGGDEFGVLLENCTMDQANRVADQILKQVNAFQFIWDDKTFNLGISIGVVPVAQHTGSITLLMSDADAACYIAKNKGRNRVHMYEPDDTEIASHHGEMSWVNRIQNALNDNKLYLVAQIIAPMETNGSNIPPHYEILVRMLDDDGSTVMPEAFLGVAERYNLTPAIDRWVVHNTFEWLCNHPRDLEILELCSINLSGNTLGDPDFSEYLLSEFKKFNIPSNKICFEITETSAIANIDVAQHFIHTFSNELHCKFSLDDFGSGLSSFAYLRTLPVDFIKIDGLFIRDINIDPINMAMVRSINEIVKLMGKKTIAEYVENESTLKQLALIGIDYAQGYYIAKPVVLSEVSELDLSHYTRGYK